MRGGLPKVLDMLRASPSYNYGRKDIEAGNKVLLPASILNQLSNEYHNRIPHPMVFSISSLRTK